MSWTSLASVCWYLFPYFLTYTRSVVVLIDLFCQRVDYDEAGRVENRAFGKMAEADERQRAEILPGPGDWGESLVPPLRTVLQGQKV